jgi:hypothetical protein
MPLTARPALVRRLWLCASVALLSRNGCPAGRYANDPLVYALAPVLSSGAATREANMGDGIPLGWIAGIRVAASWTLLIVVALLVLGLAGGVFPREYPGLAAGWYLAAAAVGAALFLVSLLAHELAHALVARRACRPTTGPSRRPGWRPTGPAPWERPRGPTRCSGTRRTTAPRSS